MYKIIVTDPTGVVSQHKGLTQVFKDVQLPFHQYTVYNYFWRCKLMKKKVKKYVNNGWTLELK